MRGLGFAVLIVGIIALLAAMNMDVSVSSGLGRVNNLGLMSQRQNFTMVAGLAVLAGLLMVIFGSKHPMPATTSEYSDGYVRPCPFCAETIKNAAIRCKHCGAEVESVGAINRRVPTAVDARGGWTVRFECAATDEMDAVKIRISDMPGEILKDDGRTVITGFFQSKDDAKDFRNRFNTKNGIEGELCFQPVPTL